MQSSQMHFDVCKTYRFATLRHAKRGRFAYFALPMTPPLPPPARQFPVQTRLAGNPSIKLSLAGRSSITAKAGRQNL
jgi:hypothetical protein